MRLESRNRWRPRAYAIMALCAAAGSIQAQITTLASFDGPNGEHPMGLVQGADGNIYGTTYGKGVGYGIRSGSIFKITPGGALTTLDVFCPTSNCSNGTSPYAGLALATNGAFYGVTYWGGAYGQGAVYRVTPDGELTTLYGFCAQNGCPDGYNPRWNLIQANHGDLYGTTTDGELQGGTLFKVTLSGMLTTIYTFCSQSHCADGSVPNSALIEAYNGRLYGTTASGGVYNSGTVFESPRDGTVTTLYSFCRENGCPDGSDPAGILQAADGNFYGITTYGADGYGTVFKLTPDGKLTTLHRFCSQGTFPCLDGANPVAMMQATDGNFYGTTLSGGGQSQGTIFEITADGTLTTLYSFCSQGGSDCTDGGEPFAGLIQATDGTFYGTTTIGGTDTSGKCDDGQGCGTVYSLSMGLGPFVETVPAVGGVGSVVTILGTNLTGATSVTFNGTAAAFTVVRPSEITTTVPVGAATGTVQVVTPNGILTSNVWFRVR